MSLETRLGIAIGCAEALSYMHSMHLTTDSLVCHGDIKPANILLDENLTARLSDFGLSRLLLGGTTRHTMNVKGSIDYVDLVCLRTGCLTPRSDVYSFGIVLLELITRKRVKEAKISLVKTFSEAFENGKMQLMEIFDDELVSEGNLEVLETIGKLAILVTEQLVKLWAGLRRGQSLLKISLGIFKRNAVSSVIRIKLQNVKVFTAGELIRVTQNYSRLIDENFMFSYVVYKGSLQDNKLVAVVRYFSGYSDNFINTVMIMSQIAHKNIIKLLGYCFEEDCPVLVFEHAFAYRRRLTDFLRLRGNKHHLSLELRLKIAVQTAQALTYIQSSSTKICWYNSAYTNLRTHAK
ncbi:wall-associated receptor kinase 5-like [Oryza brachyantha]|uniref:wall-associated receptor kinase 5-like n=1 Tax=Oryza brachyantha TaxID=4533 RepID=UPI0007763E78|nr:wall-associated receptor kinase 5-like [Oryza brachyantha]